MGGVSPLLERPFTDKLAIRRHDAPTKVGRIDPSVTRSFGDLLVEVETRSSQRGQRYVTQRSPRPLRFRSSCKTEGPGQPASQSVLLLVGPRPIRSSATQD